MGNISKIMEFVKNNLAILITASVAVASGIFNAFQYFENKKLKRYGTEKDLKRRQASLEKLTKDYNGKLFVSPEDKIENKNGFIYRKKCLKAEIEYLEKI